MNHQIVSLSGGLYFVATPIGTARDITLRALDVLASADVLAAEDTRSLRRLMDIHGVPLGDRPLIAYHDHNGASARPKLLAALEAGKSVAYASEAGMPLIADPGFDLGRAAQEEGYIVTCAPGATAITTALVLSSLPTDAFFFGGFLPNATGARKSRMQEVKDVPGTLVFYESPKRIGKMLKDAAVVFGENRRAAVCRELTKKFEEIRRGSLQELAEHFGGLTAKGEICVLVERELVKEVAAETIEDGLRSALTNMSLKDAVAAVAQAYGQPRRDVYQMALKLDKN